MFVFSPVAKQVLSVLRMLYSNTRQDTAWKGDSPKVLVVVLVVFR